MIGNLLDIALVFGAGLLIGWNVLPQPTFMRKLYEFIARQFARLRGL